MGDADDRLLTEAFADFHAEFAPTVKPAGTAAAQKTVHRRRRVRAVTTSALAALAIAVPVVAYAATSGDPHGPPPLIGGSPSATASADAEPDPSATFSPTPPTEPDGRISRADLRKAQLTIPAWPKGFASDCPTGPVKFSEGRAGPNGMLALSGDPTYVDFDKDGALETVALVVCGTQGSDYQVLALDRSWTGKILNVGKVVGSAGNTGKEGSDIMTIWGVKGTVDGQVMVDVGEYRPCCESAQSSQHQWRTYNFDGTRFNQTAGPTKFGPNPNVTDLVVSAGRLTMTKQGNGSWAGTVKVTIHNAAAFATPGRVEFGLDIDEAWQAQPGQQCRLELGTPRFCSLPGLAAGNDRVITIALKAPAGPLNTKVAAYAHAIDANGAGYADRKERVMATVQVTQG